MPRQIVNDVIPPGGRRSVRDIPVPTRRHRWSGNDELEEETHSAPLPIIPAGNGRSRHRTARWLLWGIALIALAGMGTAVGFAWGGATVTVTLKSVPVEIMVNGTASAATTTVETYLPYEPVVAEGVEEAILEPEGSRRVERKASGTIIVYNNFSSAAQRLIKNTRFETSDGKIYRITESMIVPGQKKVEGKTIPGSVETRVFADQPGTEYNIPLSDFTVPGFKSSPERYAGFYARSKTAMEGGFVGTAPFVSADKLVVARTALRTALETKLTEAVRAKLPDDTVVFAGGHFFSSLSEPEQETKEKKVLVRERGTLTAFAFQESALAHYLARRVLLRYDGDAVSLEKPEDLSFAFLNKADFRKNGESHVLFELRGIGTLVWVLDQDHLKQNLAGISRNETAAVLAKYPAIERSQVIIRPFWKKAFPDSVKRITIDANY